MSVSLRSAHLSLAAPAAIQAPAQLLDEADHLLQYNFEQSQADEIRKQARKSESLQRLLSLQLNNLQSLYTNSGLRLFVDYHQKTLKS